MTKFKPILNPNRLRDKFFSSFDINDNGCWIWHGGITGKGYGYIYNGKSRIPSHRLAYELFIGKIPDGLMICHKCDVPACVNPEHLFSGTNKDNIMDCSKKGRHGMHTHPEKRSCGPRNGMIKHPESRLYGEKSSSARLITADVIAIRKMYAAGESRTSIAEKFGMSYYTIWEITTGRTWNIPEAALEAAGLMEVEK